jgi:hypothetical protein
MSLELYPSIIHEGDLSRKFVWSGRCRCRCDCFSTRTVGLFSLYSRSNNGHFHLSFVLSSCPILHACFLCLSRVTFVGQPMMSVTTSMRWLITSTKRVKVRNRNQHRERTWKSTEERFSLSSSWLHCLVNVIFRSLIHSFVCSSILSFLLYTRRILYKQS